VPFLQKLGFAPSIPKLTAREAHKLQLSDQLVVIDVREADEWSQTGIPQNSIGISLGDPNFVSKVHDVMTQQSCAPIGLSCMTGSRSKTAARILAKSSKGPLYIIDGGILSWKASGLPVDHKVS